MATKWGVVCAGRQCHDFVTAVRSISGNEHEFVAVAARSLESAKKFAAIHNIAKCYDSYEEMAKDPDFDVAYIGSITNQHFTLAKLMLEHGKHVLVEPPLAMNLDNSKTLLKIARKKKLFLMEGSMIRFLENCQCSLDLAKNGSVGEMIHVHSDVGMNMEKYLLESRGGEVIFDLGNHILNVLCMFFNGDKPEKIAAVGHLNDEGKDISMSCSLLYSDNRTAVVTATGLADLPAETVITGTSGQIKILTPYNGPSTVQTSEKTYEFILPDTVIPCNYPYGSSLRYEAMEVRKCIQSGALESSVMPLRDSETVAIITEEICRQIGVVYPDHW